MCTLNLRGALARRPARRLSPAHAGVTEDAAAQIVKLFVEGVELAQPAPAEASIISQLRFQPRDEYLTHLVAGKTAPSPTGGGPSIWRLRGEQVAVIARATEEARVARARATLSRWLRRMRS